MLHITLLGDSIFDNGAYIGSKPDVRNHLQRLVPKRSKVTLCAVDGSRTRDIRSQISSIPKDATHLVLSVGGNDALAHTDVLTSQNTSAVSILEDLANVVEDFGVSYKDAVKAVMGVGKPLLLCTIYNGNLPVELAKAARAAVSIFNDKIYQIAEEYSLTVLELRRVCTEPSDYANPIEPSSSGGKKIAESILKFLLPRKRNER